jgi:hypothetical protein
MAGLRRLALQTYAKGEVLPRTSRRESFQTINTPHFEIRY